MDDDEQDIVHDAIRNIPRDILDWVRNIPRDGERADIYNNCNDRNRGVRNNHNEQSEQSDR